MSKKPIHDRRTFLRNTGLALTAAGLSPCGGASQARPNILWIIGEDFSPDLSCYGNPDVATPNIDRLASEGVRYTHACVTAPICSIARSALMTGMYQTSIGAHNHRSHRRDGYKLPEGVRPFTALFREAGYHTSNLKDTSVGGRGKTDFNFNLDEPPFDGADWSGRAEGQPFYAQINFSETHRAFRAFPERPIDPATVELPPYYPGHPVVREDFALYLETAQHLDQRVAKVLERLEQEGLAEDTIVFFFGDHGRPLPRGKQFCYEGGMLIPLIVRIPEKFWPAGWQPGSVSDDLISHIDVTATSLAFCGIPRPSNMEAQVFIGEESAPPREVLFCARDRADETVDRIRAARTKKWKYIRNFYPERPYTQPNHYKDTSYPPLQVMKQLKAEGRLTPEQSFFMADTRPEEELFDLDADRFEVRNLAGVPENRATLDNLRGRLEKWIEETGDTGATPENPLPAEYDLRTHADGWATSSGVMTKKDGLLHMKWTGDRNQVTCPWVVEGGEMELRFRARSKTIAPNRLFWGTVENVRGRGNEVAITFKANGAWQDISARFSAPGWLVNFGIAFDSGDGEIEFEGARLTRHDGGRARSVGEWDFA